MTAKKRNNKNKKNNKEVKEEIQQDKKEEPIFIKEFISKSEYNRGYVIGMLIRECLFKIYEQENIGLLKPSFTYSQLVELCKKPKKIDKEEKKEEGG